MGPCAEDQACRLVGGLSVQQEHKVLGGIGAPVIIGGLRW